MSSYKLTLQQQQILEMEFMGTSKGVTISGHIIMEGEGDISLIEKTIDEIFRINDALRVQMKLTEEDSLQWIDNYKKKQYRVIEFDSLEDLKSWEEEEVKSIKWSEDGINYNNLCKITGYKVRDEKFGIFAQAHHIISDAITQAMIGTQFKEIYEAYKNNREYELKVGSFTKYIENNDKYVNSKKYLKDREYWLNEFSDMKSGTFISEKYSTSLQSDRVTFSTEKSIIDKIKKYCTENNTSLFLAYMCALSIYSARINRGDVFNIATTIHSRLKPEEKITMGMFVNTVVLRLDINDEMTFNDMVKAAKGKLVKLFKHHKCNYTKTIKDLNREYRFNGALFDVIVNYQTIKVDEGGELEWYSCGEQLNSLTVSIRDWEKQGTFDFDYDYQVEKFDKEEIRYLHEHVMNILLSAVEDDNKLISEIDAIGDKEYKVLTERYADLKIDYPKEKTIIDIFEEQVERWANNIAIIFKEEKVSYKELNRRVNIVANELREMGIGRNHYVAVIIDRSIEMVVGLLAVIKAGGAYVPMDPNYPVDRLQFMLDDCKPKLVLKAGDNLPNLDSVNIVDIRDLLKRGKVDRNPEIINKPSDNLYVIFTSGTTGHPKGVIIEHKNVVRLLFNDKFQFDFNESDVWMLFHYFGFDFSVWEMYGALLYGGKLVVLSSEEAKDTYQVSNIINNQGVTVLNQVPSAFYNLMLIMENQKLYNLRYLIFGGEELRPEKLHQWYKSNEHVKVINMYGITETTVHVTYKEIGYKEIKRGISDIGKEIPTLAVYIMNGNVLSGIGMPGEICVAGEGLGKGYLNREELTASKFIKNPFGAGRLYRSGDLARRLSDGNIEYLGRIDEQVKIRGFRIELGEISNVIRKQKGVKDVVVVAKNDQSNEKNIFAYIIGEEKLDLIDIKSKIHVDLPEYMIPKYLMQLDEFPITKNGKINKDALPEITINSNSEFRAANTETEGVLVKVFSEILNVKDISTLDNFYELGGDSIKSIRAIAKLREYGYQITPKEIMELGTIELMSKRVKKINNNVTSHVESEIFGYVNETPIYAKFRELQWAKPNYLNQAIILKAKDDININNLEEAMKYTAIHHDMLRATYRDDKLYIRRVEWGEVYELRVCKMEYGTHEEFNNKANEIQSSMNLMRGPMFKGMVLNHNDEQYLLIVIHHLAVDGVSMRIVVEDLCRTYDQLINKEEVQFSSKTCSFIDWGNYLQEYTRSNRIKKEIDYWLQKDEYIRRFSQEKRENKYFDINKKLVLIQGSVLDKLYGKIRNIYNVDINEILLAAVCKTFNTLNNKKQILVELEGHGREKIYDNIELDSTVGWFTSIYPVILNCSESIEENIIFTKDEIRNIKRHGFYYGVIRYLNKVPLYSYKPDLVFNYLGDFDSILSNLEHFTAVDKPYGDLIAAENGQINDLIINAFVKNREIQVYIEYSSSVYSNKDIEIFSNTLRETVGEIVDHCETIEGTVITATDVGAFDISQDEWRILSEIYN